jgi:protein FRG1
MGKLTVSTAGLHSPLCAQLTGISPPLPQFKGEAPKKKKKKVKSAATAQEEEEELSGWMRVPSASLTLGPTYLTLPSTSLTQQPICLALQPTTGKIYPFPIPASSSTSTLAASAAAKLDSEELEAIVEAEAGAEGPSDVNHVWVCTRIPDTMNTVTFRSGSGKFLAVDELGVVSAEREARGVQEEFTLEEATGGKGIVVKSSYGKYLSVDVLAGGKMEVRADETEEGETERWRLWMQGEFLSKAKKQLMERSGVKAAVANDGLTIVGDVGAAEKDLM